MEEWEPGVGEAAGAKEVMVHRDMAVGHLGPSLGGDLGEPFLARREVGPQVGEDAVERFRGRGGKPEDGPGGGGDGGGGQDRKGETWPRAAEASWRAADYAAR